MKLNSKHIQDAVNRLFPNNRYVLFNSYVFDWESDYFSVSIPKNFCIEVEIKISQADFKKDFTHKPEKHILLSNCHKEYVSLPTLSVLGNGGTWEEDEQTGRKQWVHKEGHCRTNFVTPRLVTPNKFYYAAPEGLIKLHQIPAYAGLIEIVGDPQRTEAGHRPEAYTKKVAPFLHKENIFDRKHRTLLDKFWWETHNMRSDYEYQKWLVKELRKNFKELEVKK